MKGKIRILFVVCFVISGVCFAQNFTIQKGVIIESIKVQDSINEDFALYLPKNYNSEEKWPVLFVFDLKGRGKQILNMFNEAAEQEGYILAASNNIHDSLPLTDNILIANRMFNAVYNLFPIQADRIYTGGYDAGAKFASMTPSFIKQISGVLSCGAPIPNVEILSSKKPFHYIGIVGEEDFNYTELLALEKSLNTLKFPNQIIVFEGGHQWPAGVHIRKALSYFTMATMSKGGIPKDTSYIATNYENAMKHVSSLLTEKKNLKAFEQLQTMSEIFRTLKDVDTLTSQIKLLKKDKIYRSQKRNRNAVLFRESIIKDDYGYNLSEDIATLNYNNLGWWNYQMSELKKYANKSNEEERHMGKRLLGFLNALVEDNIDMESEEVPVNDEILSFLWMIKTISEPMNYSYYLKIISDSSRYEDFGTALFYLEELLKNGYSDKSELYTLEHTALLRITPEFNEIVSKYLKDARYEIKEE